jgi:hypothetical protein
MSLIDITKNTVAALPEYGAQYFGVWSIDVDFSKLVPEAGDIIRLLPLHLLSAVLTVQTTLVVPEGVEARIDLGTDAQPTRFLGNGNMISDDGGFWKGTKSGRVYESRSESQLQIRMVTDASVALLRIFIVKVDMRIRTKNPVPNPSGNTAN